MARAHLLVWRRYDHELCCPFDHGLTLPASQLVTARHEHLLYYEGRYSTHENRFDGAKPSGIGVAAFQKDRLVGVRRDPSYSGKCATVTTKVLPMRELLTSISVAKRQQLHATVDVRADGTEESALYAEVLVGARGGGCNGAAVHELFNRSNAVAVRTDEPGAPLAWLMPGESGGPLVRTSNLARLGKASGDLRLRFHLCGDAKLFGFTMRVKNSSRLVNVAASQPVFETSRRRQAAEDALMRSRAKQELDYGAEFGLCKADVWAAPSRRSEEIILGLLPPTCQPSAGSNDPIIDSVSTLRDDITGKGPVVDYVDCLGRCASCSGCKYVSVSFSAPFYECKLLRECTIDDLWLPALFESNRKSTRPRTSTHWITNAKSRYYDSRFDFQSIALKGRARADACARLKERGDNLAHVPGCARARLETNAEEPALMSLSSAVKQKKKKPLGGGWNSSRRQHNVAPPRLSFIVQYYKHPKQIVAIAYRVLAHPLVELIIHADSSTTEDTRALGRAKDMGGERVTILFSRNEHEIRGYNKAARVAKGDVLAFSQDDRMPPLGSDRSHWAEMVLGIFDSYGPQLGALGLHRGSSALWGSMMHGACGDASEDASGNDWRALATVGMRTPIVMSAWTNIGPVAVRKADFFRVGGFDDAFSPPGQPGIGFDTDLSARLWLNGSHVATACPTRHTTFRNACGGKGTASDREGLERRREQERVNRELLRTKYSPMAAEIMDTVRKAQERLHANAPLLAALQEAFPECVNCEEAPLTDRAVGFDDHRLCPGTMPNGPAIGESKGSTSYLKKVMLSRAQRATRAEDAPESTPSPHADLIGRVGKCLTPARLKRENALPMARYTKARASVDSESSCHRLYKLGPMWLAGAGLSEHMVPSHLLGSCLPSILPLAPLRAEHAAAATVIDCVDVQRAPDDWGASHRGTLLVNTPVCDGFFVKALLLLKAAAWAEPRGLVPVPVLTSPCDPYMPYNSSGRTGHNAWSNFFTMDPASKAAALGVGDERSQTRRYQLSEFAAFWLYSSDGPSMYASTYEQAVALRLARSQLVARWLHPAKRVIKMADELWEKAGMGLHGKTMGIHVRGTDKRIGKRIVSISYFRYADAWLKHSEDGRLFLATDDAAVVVTFRERYGRKLMVVEDAPRGSCDTAGGECAYSNAMSRAAATGDGSGLLGLTALVDTILLSRCDFLVKSRSAVSEFAIYYSPRLINASYDFELPDQPQPATAWWPPREVDT